MELIQSKKIGPEKCHPGAIYTSRPLSALISKCSSTNSSTISFGNKQGYNYNYISEEQELDIKIESETSKNQTLKLMIIMENVLKLILKIFVVAEKLFKRGLLGSFLFIL
ncbi:unnamed protein product [Rhizophagus irregularis]|nr:unnamed protein product [Rhizophagus irregularis]CAB5322498.1 unnamed protein product [Rhizophagus irregularis]